MILQMVKMTRKMLPRKMTERMITAEMIEESHDTTIVEIEDTTVVDMIAIGMTHAMIHIAHQGHIEQEVKVQLNCLV